MKRNIIFITLSFLASAFLAAGCYTAATDVDKIATTPRISAYPSSITLDKNAAEQDVIVTLNPKEAKGAVWTYSVDADWVSASKVSVQSVSTSETATATESAVKLAISANAAYKRTATLKISVNDSIFVLVPIVQTGAYPDATLSLDAEELTFMAENPEPQTFTFTSNMASVTFESSADWCTVTSNENVATVTCSPYDNNVAPRTATITVKAGSEATSLATGTVKVTQLKRDIYCYVYGSGVPKYATADNRFQMTKGTDGLYAASVYLKTGQVCIATTSGKTYYLNAAGTASETPVDYIVSVAGMNAVKFNLDQQTATVMRVTVENCLPDDSISQYSTKDYVTAKGGVKTWMTACLHWNGGPSIGGLKLGSRLVDQDDAAAAASNGGYGSTEPVVRSAQTFDEVESGGQVQGLPDETAKYGRIYTWTEALTGMPQAGCNVSFDVTAWPQQYCEGHTFTDAVGNIYTMPAGITTLSGTDDEIDAANPILSMQIQGICPYGWHIANLQDWKDLYYAAVQASGSSDAGTYAGALSGSKDVASTLRGPEGWKKGTVVRNSAADAFGFNLYPTGRRLYKTGYANYGVNAEIWICCPGAKGNVDSETNETVYKVWRVAAVTYNGTLKFNGTYDTGNAVAPIRCVKNYENY